MAEARKGAGRPQGAPAQPGLGGEAPQKPSGGRFALRAAGALQKPGFWLAIPAAAW